jgi:hypothetical protein
MAHLVNSEVEDLEFEDNKNSEEMSKGKSIPKKLIPKKSRRRVAEIYLGACPVCDGDVFGAVDAARCSDCGWTNKHSKYGWG